MPQGYKVRLEDGSEIGPLDLAAVREWQARGLIRGDSPVLVPGRQRWTTLREALGQPGASRATAPRRRTPPAPAPQRASARVTPALAAAAVAVLAVLGAAGYWLRARPEPPPATPAAAPDAASTAASYLADRRAEAVARALDAVPHLTARGAEALMRASQAEVLAPEETFRRSQVALRSGLAKLSAAERRELGTLTDALYARLTGKERARLAAYLDKLRQGRLTTPQDDREAAALARKAELKLPAARLARLRVLFEKTTLAATPAG